MNRFPKLLSLILTAGWLSLSMQPLVVAAEIEARKGELIPTPPDMPPPPGDENLVLGSIQLPPDVVKKLDAKQLADILERQVSVPKSTIEHILNENILIPTVVFSSMTLVSFLIIYYSFRKRRETLDVVRTAIQTGHTLPASFMESLEHRSKPSPDGDLRKAVLLIALGLSGVIVLAAMGEKEVGRAWSIGLVPTLLGIGYLFLWRQSQKRAKAGSNDDQR